jgi:hypothetical protein
MRNILSNIIDNFQISVYDIDCTGFTLQYEATVLAEIPELTFIMIPNGANR